MRVIQKILFTFAMVAGLTIGVSAQKEKKPTPPKQDPPVVNPAPPKNPPPDKLKKPRFAFIVWRNDMSERA